MSILADRIEQFILEKLFDDQEKNIILKRNELANELDCAPSQISYVLSTRFSNDKGFSVESRRGLGGFVRITLLVPDETGMTKRIPHTNRVPMMAPQSTALDQEILSSVPTDIATADRFIGMLLYNRRITNREARIMHDAFDVAFLSGEYATPIAKQLFIRFIREVWGE